MLIFFEKKEVKVKKKSLGAAELYEKNGSK
jgi:hypothetical protein